MQSESGSDDSVKRRLLSPNSPLSSGGGGGGGGEKALHYITNEKEMSAGGKSKREPDLRLHDAVYTVEIEDIEELLGENENLVFERDDEGRSPLHTLAIAGDEEGVEIALMLLGENGSRAEILHLTDDKGFTPAHYAADNCLPELLQVLLKFGAKPATPDVKGNTPLHLTCESGTENALKCAQLLLSTDVEGSLVNAKNRAEHTPLHCAVRKQALPMVELLLRPEHKLNFSNTLTSKGQTLFHFLSLETGETDKSCKIFKRLLEVGKPHVNLEDESGRTALHIGAIKRLPRILEMLNGENIVDVMKADGRKRTALHYAAENGAYPNGHRCVEILLSRPFKDSNKQIQYLYQMRDDLENTAFMYACLNCPVETMRQYLATIPEPQFWMSETAMALVYKQCPLAIKELFDRAFTEKEQSINSINCNEKEVILVDFGPITGYVDPVEKLPQQETKYLKQAQWWDFEAQKEILTHPLTQLFVAKKCQKLRAIIYGWIAWQLIWLLAYTLLIFSVYRKEIESQGVVVLSTGIIGFYIILSLLNEIFEGFSVGISYLISWTNFTQLAQIVLGLVAISPVLLGESPNALHKNCASTGILLAYILSMRDIGKMHEEIGLVVEVLKQVVIQIVKVLLCCSPLLIGFTLAFVVLFEDEESLNTSFPGPLVKVLVMMTGEFEYNDTFKKDEEGGGGSGGMDPHPQNSKGFRLLLFLSFLICVPVAFFNLLTGFALDRVMELREKAKVGRITKQLEHIYFIESILLSLSPLRKLVSHATTITWLRNFNVTSQMIDGEMRFETLLAEEAHRTIDRRTMKERKLDLFKYIKRIFGTELSPEVRSQMFTLASRNSR